MSRHWQLPGGASLTAAEPIVVPGDKSVSHRALMLLAVSREGGQITGLLESSDCLATLAALRALGADIERTGPGAYRVAGGELHAPAEALDLGNAGTGLRLLTGLLAGLGIPAELTGDASLRRRPMGRIVEPLRAMGALIEAEDGHAPLHLSAGGAVRGIDYRLPVASAQVKSAILLAGLHAEGETRVREPAPTRDHSERMLAGLGADLLCKPGEVRLRPGRLQGGDIMVPGDLSSAAFFLAAVAGRPGSHCRLSGVGVNPSRDGILRVLTRMGADLCRENERLSGGEPVADLIVTGTRLQGVRLDAADVALAIDEIPALMVAAAAAEGETEITGARELRVKESDRIAALCRGLEALGASVTEQAEGLILHHGPRRGGCIDSRGDHRIAMAFAMMATLLPEKEVIVVNDVDNVSTSFPNFVELAAKCGLVLEESA